jgi:hypothetical protein
MVAGCAGFVCLTCLGQSAPTFTPVTSVSGPTPQHIYALDVNNDGLSDIIQDSANPGITGSFFSVSINTGNGVFAPPVTYKINSSTWVPINWGDFNNDGKVDIAVVLPATDQVAVYLGNGDGTFQQPITTSIDLPSGMNLGLFDSFPSVVVADFNHDGNIDLVTEANNGNVSGGTWTIYLLEGNGKGGFNSSPISIYAPTSGWAVQGLFGGDFDTDGNADVTLFEQMWCSDGVVVCSSNVITLFGNGDTTFDPVDVTQVNGNITLASADLNHDGATDLYGLQIGDTEPGDYGVNPGQLRLAVYLGHYDRKFSYLYTDIPNDGGSISYPFAAADFDGTGNGALAALSATYNNNGVVDYQLMYFLNPGTPKVSIVYGPSPAGTGGYQTGPVVGNFNGDAEPDIAVNNSATDNSATSALAVGLNTTSGFYGSCDYPKSGQGIHVCTPVPDESNPGPPSSFAVTANSFGQLRKIELWVDGAKLGEQSFIWGQSGYFNNSYPGISAGNHFGTIYAADVDDRLQRYDFNFTVSGSTGSN